MNSIKSKLLHSFRGFALICIMAYCSIASAQSEAHLNIINNNIHCKLTVKLWTMMDQALGDTIINASSSWNGCLNLNSPQGAVYKITIFDDVCINTYVWDSGASDYVLVGSACSPNCVTLTVTGSDTGGPCAGSGSTISITGN